MHLILSVFITFCPQKLGFEPSIAFMILVLDRLVLGEVFLPVLQFSLSTYLSSKVTYFFIMKDWYSGHS